MSLQTETSSVRSSIDSNRFEYGQPGRHELTVEDDSHETREFDTSRRLLFTSHFLSTWNSRAFEFGAFLFLASIYPRTLLPASVYALARAGSAAVFSPWIGSYIDRANRLRVVRLSIVGQRIAVALSCILLYGLATFDDASAHIPLSYGALGVLSILACVEKLSAVMNTISVERDWVVIVAGSDENALASMNSQMRRIDLFCKVVAPLFISLMDGISSRVAIGATGGMTAASVLVEYFTIARVYSATPGLRHPNRSASISRPEDTQRSIVSSVSVALASARAYFTHRAFLPSFALALLYLTVLSFNGQMITYLVAIGLQSSVIGLLRGVSALFELSATWLAPTLISGIGPVRAGIWCLNAQLGCVIIACLSLWLDSNLNDVVATTSTIAAVIASRVGLWGFDLSAQLIVQQEVDADLRGTFSSQEVAFQNIFEMLSFASTIIFAKPEQFKIPSTVSAGAVAAASVLYAAFVRHRRGHLVHYSNCMQRDGKSAVRSTQGWRRVAQDEAETVDDVELNETIRS